MFSTSENSVDTPGTILQITYCFGCISLGQIGKFFILTLMFSFLLCILIKFESISLYDLPQRLFSGL